jgi:phosphoribosylformimino-5-aminoimidazole carboxamide ribotide isomerase
MDHRFSESAKLMQTLPVIDLHNGIVVRGMAGKRSEYRPIVSRLTAASDALSVARAFREHLGLARLYVADLDGILHGRPNLPVYRTLADDGFELLVDAGLREAAGAESVVAAGAAQVIAGLETSSGPSALAALCVQIGAARVIFSLDLMRGFPIGKLDAWGSSDSFEIGCRAAQCGVTQMIVLDVAQVGIGEGVSTMPLCRRLKERFPELLVITGGGIRTIADVQQLADAGVNYVLIASAFHDGSIGAQEIAALAAVVPS